MGIGAEVSREIHGDVTELAVEPDEQVDQPRRVVPFGAVAEELERPRPRERAKGQFQHAGPVDPAQWWVRTEPVLELCDKREPISRIV